MAITESYLKLLKFIQEKKRVSIEEASRYLNKNSSTIRREIEYLNIYLSDSEQLFIKNGYIISSLHYNEYLSFINRLSISDYSSNQIERLNLIITKAFIEQFVNTSYLYEQLSLSSTTKKTDLKMLRSFLDPRNLHLSILHKKGIKIEGSELRYRILIIEILLPLVEVNTNYIIERRKANTPFDNLIIDAFFNEYQKIIEFCQKYVIKFLNEYNLHLTYSSKKFLVLYTAISNIRKKYILSFDIEDIPIQPINLYFFDDINENIAFNHIIALLDFQHSLNFPKNENLKELCYNFINKLQKNIITNLHTRDSIVEEIYHYLYKSIIGIHYNFSFKDKMVRNTSEQLPSLFNNIKIAISDIERYYKIKFNDEHIATLTLIMRKWIDKNKILGRNQKKVIIVTNTSYERISYFIEYLQNIFEIQIINILNINEINLISNNDFHWIFTFSDRIQSIITKMNYPSIKLNFFITDEDIDKLLQAGFSRKHHRTLADSFAEKLVNKSKSEIKKILYDEYKDLFI